MKSNAIKFIVFFGLLGGVLTSWLAPKAIAWYFDPPVNIGVNCREATEWSMKKLQLAQAFGMGVGAILGLGIWLSNSSRRRRQQDSLTTEQFPDEPRV